VIATGLLHLCGIGIGLLAGHSTGRYAVRAGGASSPPLAWPF
jgi:hypothetical protein